MSGSMEEDSELSVDTGDAAAFLVFDDVLDRLVIEQGAAASWYVGTYVINI